mmetsp:Transcript_16851/g.25304  ORF Transcript_16851/g.25304 Transcript_16851/m.25304 type:complete len:221 (+) Transcript_16851:172-834(+)
MIFPSISYPLLTAEMTIPFATSSEWTSSTAVTREASAASPAATTYSVTPIFFRALLKSEERAPYFLANSSPSYFSVKALSSSTTGRKFWRTDAMATSLLSAEAAVFDFLVCSISATLRAYPPSVYCSPIFSMLSNSRFLFLSVFSNSAISFLMASSSSTSSASSLGSSSVTSASAVTSSASAAASTSDPSSELSASLSSATFNTNFDLEKEGAANATCDC